MLSLLGRALQVDVAKCDEVRHEGVGVCGVDLCKLLEHHGTGFVIKAEAAKLLRDLDQVQAKVEAVLPKLVGGFARLIRCGDVRLDLVFSHIANSFDELFLLLRVQ